MSFHYQKLVLPVPLARKEDFRNVKKLGRCKCTNLNPSKKYDMSKPKPEPEIEAPVKVTKPSLSVRMRQMYGLKTYVEMMRVLDEEGYVTRQGNDITIQAGRSQIRHWIINGVVEANPMYNVGIGKGNANGKAKKCQ